MAQQLTKPKAQELLKDLQYAKAQMGQLSTKEEYYKQALEKLLVLWEQQERGGSEWIQWVGGECPVADHVKVEYQLRAGAKGSEPARRLDWQHQGKRHDIIAYRIIPEQATNQNGSKS